MRPRRATCAPDRFRLAKSMYQEAPGGGNTLLGRLSTRSNSAGYETEGSPLTRYFRPLEGVEGRSGDVHAVFLPTSANVPASPTLRRRLGAQSGVADMQTAIGVSLPGHREPHGMSTNQIITGLKSPCPDTRQTCRIVSLYAASFVAPNVLGNPTVVLGQRPVSIVCVMIIVRWSDVGLTTTILLSLYGPLPRSRTSWWRAKTQNQHRLLKLRKFPTLQAK